MVYDIVYEKLNIHVVFLSMDFVGGDIFSCTMICC